MVQKNPRELPGIALPMAGTAAPRPQRGDALANHQRILAAARRVVTERGVGAMTIQAVADEAGVGKTTVFHRFGDRTGLTGALLDEYMRELQDAFSEWPPPLGPGAPAPERLEAFIVELVGRQSDHLALALAAEPPPGEGLALVYGVTLLHIATLIGEIDPEVDARLLAGFLLNAVAPPVLARARNALGADTPALQAAARALLRGLT